MKRNQIRQICVHRVPSPDGRSAAERINRFHARLIERQLGQSAYGQEQKAEIVEQVIQILKQKE